MMAGKLTGRKQITGAILGAVLAVGLMPGAAFASTGASDSNDPFTSGRTSTNPDSNSNSADTGFWIKVDDTKICASVPTEIHVRVKGDGGLLTPENATIKNGSIFGIHVSNIKATTEVGNSNTDSGFKLLKLNQDSAQGSPGDYKGTDKNAIYLLISGGGSGSEFTLGDCTDADGKSMASGSDWNMGAFCGTESSCETNCMPSDSNNNADGDTIKLGMNGAIYNIDKDLGKDTQFAKVSWTFKGGHLSTTA